MLTSLCNVLVLVFFMLLSPTLGYSQVRDTDCLKLEEIWLKDTHISNLELSESVKECTVDNNGISFKKYQFNQDGYLIHESAYSSIIEGKLNGSERLYERDEQNNILVDLFFDGLKKNEFNIELSDLRSESLSLIETKYFYRGDSLVSRYSLKNEDTLAIEEIKINSMGCVNERLTSHGFSRNRTFYKYEYTPIGNLIAEEKIQWKLANSAKKTYRKIDYLYHKDGKLHQIREFYGEKRSPRDTILFIYDVDTIKEVRFNNYFYADTLIVKKYDSEGRIIEDRSSSINHWESISREFANKQIARELTYINIDDGYKRITKDIKYNSSGHIISIDEYDYRGNHRQKLYNESGDLVYSSFPSGQIEYAIDGTQSEFMNEEYFSYEYDINGNWTIKKRNYISMKKSGLIQGESITTRKITYW